MLDRHAVSHAPLVRLLPPPPAAVRAPADAARAACDRHCVVATCTVVPACTHTRAGRISCTQREAAGASCDGVCVCRHHFCGHHCRATPNNLTAVGFEPTQLALVELESTPLDHSGKLSLDDVGAGRTSTPRRCTHEVLWPAQAVLLVSTHDALPCPVAVSALPCGFPLPHRLRSCGVLSIL